MSRSLYKEEIQLAKFFLNSHSYDTKLLGVIREASNPKYLHSERWSIIYNFITKEYPGVTSGLITGLSYLSEGG